MISTNQIHIGEDYAAMEVCCEVLDVRDDVAVRKRPNIENSDSG